jgi:hypothetical protein
MLDENLYIYNFMYEIIKYIVIHKIKLDENNIPLITKLNKI